MKKLFALLLVLALALSMTAAVAEGNNVNAEGYQFPDYSGKTMTIMWWGSDTRAQKTIEMIELYEKLTGLKIEYEYFDGGSYWTQFQAKQAGGALPDVFQMGNNWLTYYDTIEPLNKYIEDGTIDTSTIPRSSTSAAWRIPPTTGPGTISRRPAGPSMRRPAIPR